MAMLQVGAVAFETTGPHYEKLKHLTKGDWARQKRFGRRDAMQWTGWGDESVHINGTIYPDYYGGFDALATLRSQMPEPQMIVSGAGDVFGLFCILDVGNEQTRQYADGTPRKVTFEVSLTAYGEDGFAGIGGGLGAIIGLAGVSAGITVPGISVGIDVGASAIARGIATAVRLF